MNEKIKQLAEQARVQDRGYFIYQYGGPTGTMQSVEKVIDLEKFAELIVRECVGVVEGGHFLHDQAPTALFAKECSGAVKKHFGVKE